MFKLRKGPCALEESVWKQDAILFQCSSPERVYHCTSDENKRLGEICVQPIWVNPNYCPEYNTGAHTLDIVSCNESTGSCPDALFLSNEVYKYPACLNKTYSGGENGSNEDVSLTPAIYIGVALFLFIILLAVCLIVYCRFIYRKRRYRREDEDIPLLDEKEPFYKTSAYYEGVTFLGNGGKILCLGGLWGSGKSSTAKQVYMAVTKSTPIIISDLFAFDASKHYKPIIVSQTSLKGKSHEELEHFKEKIRIFFNDTSSSKKYLKVFIILILKENEDREAVSEFVKSFVTREKDIKFIDLSKSLTKGDRTQILYSQFERFCPNKDFSKIENLAIKGNYNSLGYPEICALFCRCNNLQTVGPLVFCNQPLRYLKSYLGNMHQSDDKEKFLMLVCMSLNHMEINVNSQSDMFSGILESCNCTSDPTSKETKGETEQNELSGIDSIGERSNIDQGPSFRNQLKPKKHYISKEYITSLIPEEFVIADRLQHDVIKRMTLIVYGTHHFDKLLELSKPEELKAWVKEKGMKQDVGLRDIKPVLEIDRKQWKQFQAKLSY
ncbi:uncharacterized protein [Magallana gigas]|uniref:uncharacterized protein n=1 Tax=Magallana gigas TaxID=29159 RepID=UPI0033404515